MAKNRLLFFLVGFLLFGFNSIAMEKSPQYTWKSLRLEDFDRIIHDNLAFKEGLSPDVLLLDTCLSYLGLPSEKIDQVIAKLRESNWTSVNQLFEEVNSNWIASIKSLNVDSEGVNQFYEQVKKSIENDSPLIIPLKPFSSNEDASCLFGLALIVGYRLPMQEGDDWQFLILENNSIDSKPFPGMAVVEHMNAQSEGNGNSLLLKPFQFIQLERVEVGPKSVSIEETMQDPKYPDIDENPWLEQPPFSYIKLEILGPLWKCLPIKHCDSKHTALFKATDKNGLHVLAYCLRILNIEMSFSGRHEVSFNDIKEHAKAKLQQVSSPYKPVVFHTKISEELHIYKPFFEMAQDRISKGLPLIIEISRKKTDRYLAIVGYYERQTSSSEWSFLLFDSHGPGYYTDRLQSISVMMCEAEQAQREQKLNYLTFMNEEEIKARSQKAKFTCPS